MTVEDVTAVEVGQTFMELYHQMHRVVDGSMSAAGLSLTRAKVLMRLTQHGPMNQSTLAGLLGFAPRSVTDTIDALERDGMVRRLEDEKDRRARIVEITPVGTEAHETAMVTKRKVFDEIFGTLSAGQRADLAALLATIRTNLPSGDPSCVR